MIASAASASVDALDYPGAAWSPYVAGVLIGLLVLVMMVVAGKKLGASSGYASFAGLLGKAIAPRRTERLRYFRDNPPKVDWSTVFVPAIVIGAFVAAWSGGELTGRFIPPLWAERFGGDTFVGRTAAAFAGGVLIAFGARLAGGCTSGHGISGTLQASAGSWVSVLCFFVGGVIAAWLLYLA